jgi:hypothetical protein
VFPYYMRQEQFSCLFMLILVPLTGKLAEYDVPLNLMNKEGSLFGQLVKEYWSRSTNNGTY